jgi:hypothetical protein
MEKFILTKYNILCTPSSSSEFWYRTANEMYRINDSIHDTLYQFTAFLDLQPFGISNVRETLHESENESFHLDGES